MLWSKVKTLRLYVKISISVSRVATRLSFRFQDDFSGSIKSKCLYMSQWDLHKSDNSKTSHSAVLCGRNRIQLVRIRGQKTMMFGNKVEASWNWETGSIKLVDDVRILVLLIVKDLCPRIGTRVFTLMVKEFWQWTGI